MADEDVSEATSLRLQKAMWATNSKTTSTMRYIPMVLKPARRPLPAPSTPRLDDLPDVDSRYLPPSFYSKVASGSSRDVITTDMKFPRHSRQRLSAGRAMTATESNSHTQPKREIHPSVPVQCVGHHLHVGRCVLGNPSPHQV
jgi:hypothetical protein